MSEAPKDFKDKSNQLLEFLRKLYPDDFACQMTECIHAFCRIGVEHNGDQPTLAMTTAQAILSFPGWRTGKEEMNKVYYPAKEKESVH